MRASEADVLINAVKTFVLFSPENERVISPLAVEVCQHDCFFALVTNVSAICFYMPSFGKKD